MENCTNCWTMGHDCGACPKNTAPSSAGRGGNSGCDVMKIMGMAMTIAMWITVLLMGIYFVYNIGNDVLAVPYWVRELLQGLIS